MMMLIHRMAETMHWYHLLKIREIPVICLRQYPLRAFV